IRGVSITIGPSLGVMVLADGRLVFREIFNSLRAALALAKRGDRLQIGFDPARMSAIIETPSGAVISVPLSLSSLVEAVPTESHHVHA
ncbi:MAG: hypothetical protein ACXWUG_11365, partial [Polyangiales bacterium]